MFTYTSIPWGAAGANTMDFMQNTLDGQVKDPNGVLWK